MRAFKYIFLTSLILLGTSACTIRHVVEADYPQYLVNNRGTANLPETKAVSEYWLTRNTQDHSYEFRAVVTGYANLWIVEFGKMLDDTLMSADVQKAFGGLQKTANDTGNSASLLIFDLQSYTFEDFGARISLKISMSQMGKVVFSKTYQKVGKTQGGKMFWAGAFGQKNAVQQSTKLALDEILGQLINDLNSLSKAVVSQNYGPERSFEPGSGVQLRAVNDPEKNNCDLIKLVNQGVGGPGHPSVHLERAMQMALKEAASLGANFYFVVDTSKNTNGASVILEALNCR